MSDAINWVGDLLTKLAPYLPAGFGALIGLRYAKDQTPKERAISWIFGFVVSIYFAPAIAEVLGYLPDKSPRIFVVISILTAMLGMDILAGVMAVTKAFALAPLATFKDWWAIWRNR